MPEYLAKCESLLANICLLVREKLSKLVRSKLVALITIDVHARDIVEKLNKDRVISESDFGWQMQLRCGEYDN